jgi:hypothetical protein
MVDEGLGDVDPGHAGTPLGKQPRVVPFPAANIEAVKALHIRKHLEEGRGVQAVAVVVVAGTYQLSPHLGVSVPVPADSSWSIRLCYSVFQRLPADLSRKVATHPVLFGSNPEA